MTTNQVMECSIIVLG